MAHNLNLNKKTGLFAFASNQQKAWHGLGQIVNGAMTAQQAIENAQLNYEVRLDDVYAFDNVTKKAKKIADKFATVRVDNGDVFGVVGNRYQIVQNKDAFSFFDAIVGQDLAMYETAGALGMGEKIFITAKLPEFIRIAGTDDLTEVYVLLTSSHDGSGAVIAAITPVRVVCQNTLNAALGNTISKVSVRHTTNVKQNLEQAHKLLGISHKFVEELSQCFNVLAKKPISDAQVQKLLEELFKSEKEDSTRVKNIREAVMLSYHTGIGQREIMGTAWGVFNGITHYLDHEKSYKDASVKFESVINGASAQVAEKALNMLVKL